MTSNLKIVLGSNYFSISELAHMQKGDVAVTSLLAGKPAELVWNNNTVAYGEIVVIDRFVGFRMTSFSCGKENRKPPFVKEKLIDMVEASVVLSEKESGFDEIREIKEHSIILFGDLIDENLAGLYMGGFLIAKGKICVIGENFGMEVSEKYFPLEIDTGDYPYKSTGNIIKSERKKDRVKYYDFRKPDKFSLIQLNNMMKIHEIFIDNVMFNIKEKSGSFKARIRSIDQFAFYELFDGIKNLKTDIVKFDSGSYKSPVESVLELKSSPNKLSNEGMASLKNFMEKRFSIDYQYTVFVIYGKENPFVEQKIFEISFKKAWETVTHVEPEIIKKNADFNHVSTLLPEYDMICIIEIEYENNSEKGKMTIVYPYITIENILTKLSDNLF